MRALIWVVASGLLGLGGCGAGPRFRDQPTVWQVDDARDVPQQPAEREFLPYRYFSDIYLFRRLPRALELNNEEPAHNTNALDEVPDSTWFTNRIGVRVVSPKEAAHGTSNQGEPVLPITVVAGKGGGANPGFFVTDATGRRFLVKFDTKDNPEMQTATGVIVNRIFWTLGYNVPADHVFHFCRADLKLSPDATLKDEMLRKRSLTEADIEEALLTSPRRPDGCFRASSSEFLPGVPLGGISPEGFREDDPNDTIAHEHHRELRGLRVFAAWTGHTDMKEDNTIDMYVEADGKHFVRHHLLDFGEALGAHQAEKGRYEDGWEHYWDWENQTLALFAFGLWKRPWESHEETPWLSIGAFGPDPFEPRLWREAYPYWPFMEMDAADAYWGAKLVMRFDRPVLEAIVAQGKLSHSDAAAFLVDALLERRIALGREYLEGVTPLDQVTITPNHICAVDLGMRFGLATTGVVERLDPHDAVIDEHTVAPDGAVCLPILPHGRPDDDYRIDRLRVRRGRDRKPVMQLHYKPGETPRVLGVVRVER